MLPPVRLAVCLGLLGAVVAGCSPAAGEPAAIVAPATQRPGDGASASPSPPRARPSTMPMPTQAPGTTPSGAATMRGVFRITTSKPIFFITVDDGYAKPRSALTYIASRKLPVTTFLTNAAVDGDYAYFAKVSRYDAVQNHTMSHKALSKQSTDRHREICGAQTIYTAKFGQRPWILRPPYGAGFMPRRDTTPQIERTAASCGIKHIALWDVTISASGKVEYANERGIRRGDIVLLHFEGDVAANLRRAVAIGRAAGLTPASLSAYLAP